MSAIVTAPCRLHFGLMHVPIAELSMWPDGTPVRKFGGVGLMIDKPQVSVKLHLAPEWRAEGSLAERALDFAKRVWYATPHRGENQLELVANGPPEHVGLGVGTALGLAIARGISLYDLSHRKTTAELAHLVGRGERSGIGLHGFDRGGFLIDGGKVHDGDAPELLIRLKFPDEWRVVLFRPDVAGVWHGDRERQAFARQRPVEETAATTAWLQQFAIDVVARAVCDVEFKTFSESIHEYNRRAGEPFAVDQGGTYAGAEVTQIIETVRSWGVAGVGQSSWGPTVFAFAPDPEAAASLAERGQRELSGLVDVTVAAANNRGAITAFKT